MTRRPGKHRVHRQGPLARAGICVAIAAALIGTGGAAHAFWSAGGDGISSAATAERAALSLSPATTLADLYPGGSADVVLTITNPNAAGVQVGSFSLDAGMGSGGLAVDAGHAACDLSALSFTPPGAGPGWTVPAAASGTPGSTTATLPSALAMSLDAANACQGATITVYLSAGP